MHSFFIAKKRKEVTNTDIKQKNEQSMELLSNVNNAKCTVIIPRNEKITETNRSCSNRSCAGVFNFPQKLSNCDKLTLYCKYTSVDSNARYDVAYKNKVPQIISKQCDDIGIWRGDSLEWKCNECYSFFQKMHALTKRMVDKRNKLFKKNTSMHRQALFD